jgi:antitoxin ParD1/3/4
VATVTMSISLPDELRAFVDSEVAAHAYPSTSAYVQHLIRREASTVKLHEQLMVGERSGEPIVVDETYWSDLRLRVSAARQTPA